jgi:hypothetical protein
MADKLIEKIGDISVNTYFEDMVKHVKFTNEVDFQQDWSLKKGKYRMELYIDKHHHQITLKVNKKIVFQDIVA